MIEYDQLPKLLTPEAISEAAKDPRRSRTWAYDVEWIERLRRLASFRAMPWYWRAWLTLTGKAPR